MYRITEHRVYNDGHKEDAHIYFSTVKSAEEYNSLVYKKYVRLSSTISYVIQDVDITIRDKNDL